MQLASPTRHSLIAGQVRKDQSTDALMLASTLVPFPLLLTGRVICPGDSTGSTVSGPTKSPAPQPPSSGLACSYDQPQSRRARQAGQAAVPVAATAQVGHGLPSDLDQAEHCPIELASVYWPKSKH